MKEKAQKKKIHFEIFTVLIFIATLFMSIVYAQISDIKLAVTGEVNAKAQDGVFILDITKSDASSGVVSDEIKYYKGTTLSTSIELSSSTSSSLTYDISLYNNSSNQYYFKGVAISEEAYDNTKITYSIDGLQPYITTIDAKETLSFNLTFKYADGITPSTSQVLNSMINFEFSTEMIEFTLAEAKYSAQTGATWQQFIESVYNTYGFSITDGKVYTSSGEQVYNLDKEIKSTDLITKGATYNYKPELTLDKESIQVEIEEGTTATENLTATLTNIEKELTWTSSDTCIAEVVGNGNTATVTMKAEGTAEITVSCGELSTTCTVNVTKKKNVPTVSESKNKVLSTTSNTNVYDEYGNKIVVPAGFKIRVDEGTRTKGDANSTATHVTEGIVIEDANGNQFVWVPVGKIYTDVEKTESLAKTITLGRYSDFTATNGVYTPAQTGKDYSKSTIIDSYYTEDITSSNEKAVARDLEGFITSVIGNDKTEGNAGYYIGRYEASNVLGGIGCKTGMVISNGYMYSDASDFCIKMYNNGADGYKTGTFSSDLINSYAWDTAIIFIQTFGGETASDYYSQNNSKSLTTTGGNQDEYCNINDMSGNALEFSTESYNDGQELLMSRIAPPTSDSGSVFVNRGGYYHPYTKKNIGVTSERRGNFDAEMMWMSYRPILYVAFPTANLILDKESIEVEIEEGTTATQNLTATLENAEGDLIWTSSNVDVAEVVGNGNTATVTLNAAGTATITVSCGELSATCTVTVTEKSNEIITNKLNNTLITIDDDNTSYTHNYEYGNKTLTSTVLTALEGDLDETPAGIFIGTTETSNIRMSGPVLEIKRGSMSPEFPEGTVSEGTVQITFIFSDGTTDTDTFKIYHITGGM